MALPLSGSSGWPAAKCKVASVERHWILPVHVSCTGSAGHVTRCRPYVLHLQKCYQSGLMLWRTAPGSVASKHRGVAVTEHHDAPVRSAPCTAPVRSCRCAPRSAAALGDRSPSPPSQHSWPCCRRSSPGCALPPGSRSGPVCKTWPVVHVSPVFRSLRRRLW